MIGDSRQLDLNTIVSLCKRRGFIFQSSEIYGGLASTWDYGPLGIEIKRNIKDAWWRTFVWDREDIVGLDAAILMHGDVWKASGHVENFTDPLVECRGCNQRFREDQLNETVCPNCSAELGDPRMFNLMLKTHLGPVEDEASLAYLRPETAQGIFVNFSNVLNSSRRKIPFGIAQIGKSFRNEITTGNFIFRTREFEIMELEHFINGTDATHYHERWIHDSYQWYTDLGVNKESLRIRHHESDELAHYSKSTADIEYRYPWGWGEIAGVANRADYDLKAHSEASGQALTFFDDSTNQHITPHVIEPTFGVDRAFMTFLVDSYTEEQAPTSSGKDEKRVLLKLHPTLAPIKVAILPLSRNEKLAPLARQVYDQVRKSGAIPGVVQYDDAQSIGRRYRRQDEVGTPICVTVDFDSLEDQSVTLRERDTMLQSRVPINDLVGQLSLHYANMTIKSG